MNILRCIVLGAGLLAGGPAQAGEAADRLAQCLVGATRPADRTALVRWMVGALAAHPDLVGLVTLDPAQRDASERAAAATFERLVAVDCAAATREAIAREGTDGFGKAFEAFGGMAMTDVVEQRDVQARVGRMVEHVDLPKLMRALLAK